MDEVSMQKAPWKEHDESVSYTYETATYKDSMETIESSEFDHLYDFESRMRQTQLHLNHDRTPVTLQWHNLTYSVKIKDPKSTKKCRKPAVDKIILDNISGKANPGELCAILGPSGSGKTTLLNILSGRCVKTKGAHLYGHISVNNMNKNELGSNTFSQISAFVQQDDVLFNMQTVKETLLNSARLRLPKTMSLQQKQDRVNRIIQELGLKKAANTRVGDARHRGISGGERKRTNIAVEMIQDPSLLFLDEPTSGLDAFQALNVMETLKILCMSGVTVIVSVHQPRSAIYKLFDQIILLCEGRIAYSGSAAGNAVNYFSKIGLRCPSFFHPADYFLDIISVDNRSTAKEIRSEKRIQFILEAYAEYEGKHRNDVLLNSKGSIDTLQLSYSRKGVTSGICEQFIILATRNLRQISRDVFTLGMRLFMTMFFALFLSALWFDMGQEQKDIQNRLGILFFIAINQSFGGMTATLAIFHVEKTIVMRERQAHCYYLWIYYLTKLFTQLPLDVIIPCILASIVYWIVGLNPDPIAFIMFLFLTVLISISAVGVGFMVGACAPNIDAANAMAPLFMVLTILFGGFYINSGSMPAWIGWLEYLSTIKWCFEAYCMNEFTGLKFCDDEFGCRTGEEELNLLSFDKYSIWTPTIALIALFALFHLIAFSFLKFAHVDYIQCEPLLSLQNGNTYDRKPYDNDDFDGYKKASEDQANELPIEVKQVHAKQNKKANQKTPLLKS